MAEPTNTPFPPSTPLASTPRATSPAPPTPPSTTTASSATMPIRSNKLAVLHIGDPVKYNLATHDEFRRRFDIIRPSAAERERPAFLQALKDRKWGDFHAIFRPFWGTGGEMGKWDRELIDLLPETVKVFASAGAGFDWADTKLLGEKGIIYCNSAPAAAEAVADFAVALVISTFRALPWVHLAAVLPYLTAQPGATAEKSFFHAHSNATAVSRNPRGHVLGLIGFGNIGQQIAAKLGHPAMGMRVHYFDVLRKTDKERELGAKYEDSLEALLGVADCVVLATPANPAGGALMTASVFAHFKPGARFVNVARGSLVDEDALADALEKGIVSTAALDVHADEPRVNPRLVRFAGLESPGQPGRLMLTCHNAGGTVDTHIGFEEMSMRNVMAVLEGGQAMTPVNREWLRPKI